MHRTAPKAWLIVLLYCSKWLGNKLKSHTGVRKMQLQPSATTLTGIKKNLIGGNLSSDRKSKTSKLVFPWDGSSRSLCYEEPECWISKNRDNKDTKSPNLFVR